MIFVRNLRSPTMSADNLISHVMALYFKELMLLGNWTHVDDNGDAAWTTCVSVNELGGASGFQVSAANPRIVYSSAGVFTTDHVTSECALFLRAANDQNKVAAKIKVFIDANHVELQTDSVPPGGWVDEGGVGSYIPGRIIKPNAATLAIGAWVRLQAPTGNHQTRLVKQSATVMRCYSRPKGALGVATETPTAGIDTTVAAASRYMILHAVFDGSTALIYGTGRGSSSENMIMLWGALEGVATGDTDPNFIYGGGNFAGGYPQTWPLGMLDNNPTPQPISGYVSALKYYGESLGGTTYATIYANEMWRLQNGRPGKYALYRPLVVLANRATYGGGPRGRMPLIRTGNVNLEKFRPMDAAGNWLHLAYGFTVPRNGPLDWLPQIAYAT